MTGSERHAKAIETLFPHPVRFMHIWSKRGGKKDGHWWRPVPPSSDYVALGDVCITGSDDPPPEEIVHCVPRDWVVRAGPGHLKLIWEDSGTGGRKGSVWQCNGMGLCIATTGHEAPHVDRWELSPPRE